MRKSYVLLDKANNSKTVADNLHNLSWFDHMRDLDEKLHTFTINSIKRGYLTNGISEDLVIQIINILENENLEQMFQFVPYIIENPGFKEPRKDYENEYIRYNKIMEYINQWIDENSIVLDIGCGHGDMAPLLLNKRIKKYIGSDICLPPDLDENLLKNKRVKFIKQDSKTIIPIPDASVDIILMVDMLHHVDICSQDDFLIHLKTKLRPNGKVIIFEYTFSETEKPLLNNETGHEFMDLTLLQKLNYLTIMDWISNVLFLNREMPMPYSFRTYEEWKCKFDNLDYKMSSCNYIGFPEEFFHQGPYCLFILEDNSE